MTYSLFIADLTEPQVRALACQSGISSWVTYPVSKLRRRLLDNAAAQEIFEANYG